MKRIMGVFLLVFLVGNPVAVHAASGLPFQDGFESGDFSAWLPGRTNGFSVSSSDHSTGSYAARGVSIMGQTTDYYMDRPFGDHPQAGGVPIADGVYFKFAHKYDTGFDLGRTQNYNKIFLMNFENPNNLRRDQVIFETAVNYDSGSRRGEYIFEPTHWNPDGSWLSGSLLFQNRGTPAKYREGQWDLIKIYIKPNTPNVANGVLKLWVNGVLKAEHTDVNMRLTSYNLNLAIVGSYVTVTDVAGIRWWDDILISETDPDNPAPNVKYPNPPTEIRVDNNSINIP
ncbi:MAG TPA: hypothetical protein VN450_08670 [Candidatus Methylomirabilis sp.]|nr:hypothetical protein [Candidatus Methylomirabilis sp.]